MMGSRSGDSTSRGGDEDTSKVDLNRGDCEEQGGPIAIESPKLRVTLGFLAARRRLMLPDVGFDNEDGYNGDIAALAVLDRFGFVLVSCASGVLVYSTKALATAALQESDPDDVPVHADVKLGGRPSCMAVSRDNLRVAVALQDKVLIFDTPALASGSQDPEETVKLPVDGSGVCDPPRALSWGEGAAGGGVAYLLLIVGADRSASIARVGGTKEFAGEGGDLAVEPVAGGERVFTSGCWLWQGMGRFALGTVAGEVKVFQESGLKTPIGSTPFPAAQLDMSPKAEVNHLTVTETGALLAVYYDSTAENDDAARIAEFVVPRCSSSANPVLRSFEGPDSGVTPIPSFDAPEAYKFRSHVARVIFEKEDALLLTHSLNDGCPAVLICVAGGKGKERWNAFALNEGWDFEVEGFPMGFCVSHCLDEPVPPQRTNQASAFGPGPLVFALSSTGELWCAVLVHPLSPEVVIRRRTAPTAQSLEEAAAAADEEEGSTEEEDGEEAREEWGEEDDGDTEEEDDDEGAADEGRAKVEPPAPTIPGSVVFGGGNTGPPVFGGATGQKSSAGAGASFGFGASVGGAKPGSSSIFAPRQGDKGKEGSGFLKPFAPFVAASGPAPASSPAAGPFGAPFGSFLESSGAKFPSFSSFSSSSSRPAAFSGSNSPSPPASFDGGSVFGNKGGVGAGAGGFPGFGGFNAGAGLFGSGGSASGGLTKFNPPVSSAPVPPAAPVMAARSTAKEGEPKLAALDKPPTGIPKPSAPLYPPMSLKSPSVFGEPEGKIALASPPAAKESSAAVSTGKTAAPSFGFTHASTKKSSIFGKTKQEAAGPSVFGAAKQEAVAPAPAAAKSKATSPYPPMSLNAPSVFGEAKQKAVAAAAPAPAETKAKSASPYPPMSVNAPSVFGAAKQKAVVAAAPAPAETKAKSASPYPPMSVNAPSVFGAAKQKAVAAAAPAPAETTAKSASPYPPMSVNPPSVFGALKPVAPSVAAVAPAPAETKPKAVSAYPPMSHSAPTVFGGPARVMDSSRISLAAANSAAAPARALGQKSATAAASSENTSSSFGRVAAPKPPSSSASGYPPMSSKAPSEFGGTFASSGNAETKKPPSTSSAFLTTSNAATKATSSGSRSGSTFPPFSSKPPVVFGAAAAPVPGSQAKTTLEMFGGASPKPFGGVNPPVATGFPSNLAPSNLFGAQPQPKPTPILGGFMPFGAPSASEATTSPSVSKTAASTSAGASYSQTGFVGGGGSGVITGDGRSKTRAGSSAVGGSGDKSAQEKNEWRQDFGDDGSKAKEKQNQEEFSVPEIPELSVRPWRTGPDGGRRQAAPPTVAKTVLKDVFEVLERLREKGEAGPLRDGAWLNGMEQGIDGLRATICRLREAVGGLGRGTATLVAEVGTLKANNGDIKWQTEVAKGWLDREQGGGDEEESGEFPAEDGREPLSIDMIHLRKSIRTNRRIIETVMADLVSTLNSRRERRADLDVRAAAAAVPASRGLAAGGRAATPASSSTPSGQGATTERSSPARASVGDFRRPGPAAARGAGAMPNGGVAYLRGGTIHGVLPPRRRSLRPRSGGILGDGTDTVNNSGTAAVRASCSSIGSATSPFLPATATPDRASRATISQRSPASLGANGTPAALSSAPGSAGSWGSDGLRRSQRARDASDAGTPVQSSAMVVAAERPGLRLLRVVGTQYDATFGVEAWVEKAEARVQELERAAEAAAANKPELSSSALELVNGGGKRENPLARGQRLRREQAGVALLSKQASKMSGTFELLKAGKIETVTEDQLAECLGNRPGIVTTPHKTPSRLYTGGRGPESVHQPSSSASRNASSSKPAAEPTPSSRSSTSVSTSTTSLLPAPMARAPTPSVVGGGFLSKQASFTGSASDPITYRSAATGAGGGTKIEPKTASAYPPLAAAAPKVFGEAKSGDAGPRKTPAPAPGPVIKAPAPSGTAKSSVGSAAFPPMAKASPKVFGGEAVSSTPAKASITPAPAPAKVEPKGEVSAAPSPAPAAATLPTPFGAGSGFGASKPFPFGGGGGGGSTFGSVFGSSTSSTTKAAATTTPAAPAPASGLVGLSTLSEAAASVVPAPQSTEDSKASGAAPAPSAGGLSFGMGGLGAALGGATQASASAATGGVEGGSGAPNYRQQVVDIYTKYNKDKLTEVDAFLAKYRGQEATLIAKLKKKYENAQMAAPAPGPARAAASPFGNPGNNASAGGTGGMFSTPATTGTPSPFGAGAGFGAPKPSVFGSGSGGAVFGQPSSAPTAFGQQPKPAAPGASPFSSTPAFGDNTASTTPSPFGAPAPSAPTFGAVAPAQGAPPFVTPGASAPTQSPFGAPTAFGQQQQQASPFAPPPSGRGDLAVLKAWLTEVYSRFKPENVSKIDKLMVKYMNVEGKMIDQIIKKYGANGVTAPPGWSTSALPAGGGGAPAMSPSGPQTPTGFGQATPAFGQTSTFGQGSGMGFGGQAQQPSPFGNPSPTAFGTPNAFGSSAGTPAPSPFGGGSSGFGAPSALGGGGVFGAPAQSAPVPAKVGGFGAFASGGTQPSFGAGGGFGSFASQAQTTGFGAVAGSAGGFGGTTPGNSSSGGFTGSSFRQFRG